MKKYRILKIIKKKDKLKNFNQSYCLDIDKNFTLLNRANEIPRISIQILTTVIEMVIILIKTTVITMVIILIKTIIPIG